MTAENEVLTPWIVFCHCCGVAYLQMGRINFLSVTIRASFLLLVPSSMFSWNLDFLLNRTFVVMTKTTWKKDLVLLSLLVCHILHRISIPSVLKLSEVVCENQVWILVAHSPGCPSPLTNPITQGCFCQNNKKRENFRSALRSKKRISHSS